MAVIFDLDMTIVDSGLIEPLRRKRSWSEVYKKIPTLVLYDGIFEAIKTLNENNIRTAIVTSSPSSYCKKVINHFGINVDKLVCYHDTVNHKPHPEPIEKALSLLNVECHETIAIGDAGKDILAAKDAGVLSVAALWDATNPEETLHAEPDFKFFKASDYHAFLCDRFSISPLKSNH